MDADALAQDRETMGQLLETSVVQEIRRQASWRDEDIRFHHFRTKEGAEVDLVLEQGARTVAGVEVKASATVTAADFRGLRKLRDAFATPRTCRPRPPDVPIGRAPGESNSPKKLESSSRGPSRGPTTSQALQPRRPHDHRT